MPRSVPLVLLTALAIAGAPSALRAQTATPAHAADAPADPLTVQERDALTVAQQLAAQSSQNLERWIATQAITEQRLFARIYFPIARTDPQKFATPYDALADRDVLSLEDRALGHSPSFLYAILTDVNGYVPAHNSRFAQPLTGNTGQDSVNNRTKRMLGELSSLLAARSEAPYLLQRTRLETGEIVYDVSVPVVVHGKHWGCARIGFSRTE